MVGLNNDEREILYNMVTEKAEAKRKKLTEDLTAVDNECYADYKARLASARDELERLVVSINREINRIFRKHRLKWKECEYSGDTATFEDIFSYGKLKQDEDIEYYIGNAAKIPNRRFLVEMQLEELDARVAKAKQEILLRAALGTKYDEVVGIINGFQF